MDIPPLNPEAEEVLEAARNSAARRGLDQADHVDILLALAGHGTRATEMLRLFDVDFEQLEELGRATASPWGLPADPFAEERTADLARLEAAHLDQEETGSEHLVAALAYQPGNLAVAFLEAHGITPLTARDALRHLHGQAPEWQRPVRRDLFASASGSMVAVPADEYAEFSEAESRRFDEMHGRYFEIGSSRLVRVVPVGQAMDADGVLIELTAIEMREAGAVLLWRTVTGDDRMLGPPDVSVGDDAGTEYEINWGSWSGSDHESRGETRFRPSPPTEATALFVEIKSFGGGAGTPIPDHVPMPWHRADGPWSFEVLLRA